MTPRTLNRQQSREVDRRAIDEYGMRGLVLMENAGRGVADVLCELGIDGPVAICCGKGNNAGDGFVIARHLDLRGFPVRVVLAADPGELAGDARENYAVLSKSDVLIDRFAELGPARFDRHLAESAWIVDALLGTGAQGEPRPPVDHMIARMNAAGRPILAVDLPSGLDCDRGVAATQTVRAALTCTFVAAKPGFLVAGADRYVGQLRVLDIGIPRKLFEQILGAQASPATHPRATIDLPHELGRQ